MSTSTRYAMNSDPKTRPQTDETSVPANAGLDIPAKANLPDDDRTVPGTMPSLAEEAVEATGEDELVQEHHTGRDHAEPTDVTGTTNDNAIDSEYIDLGGGD
jgi:hypothetical protein